MRIGIQKRIFLLFGLTILVVVVITGYIMGRNLTKSVMDMSFDYMNKMLNNASISINTEISIIHSIIFQLSVEDELNEDKNALTKLLNRYRDNFINDIDSICMIYSNEPVTVGTSNVNTVIADFRNYGFYRQAIDAGGNIVWSSPYYGANMQLTMTCTRAIYTDKELLGVLAINVSINKISRNVDIYRLGDRGVVYLIPPGESSFFFRSDNDKYFNRLEGQRFNDYISDNLGTFSFDSFIDYKTENGKKYKVMISHGNASNWKMVGILEENEISDNIKIVKESMLAALIILLILLFVLSFLIAGYISQPIKMIAASMNRIKLGDINEMIILSRSDEIGDLAESFNHMTRRLKDTLDDSVETENKKKVFELKMLQYQLNPHFLYNTLNTVDFLVVLGKNEKVHPMITSLIKLLQSSIDKLGEYITVENEIENIKNYLLILSMRYEKKFNVHYKIDDDTIGEKTLSLMLQPIIENAIFHGIQPCEGVRNLYIRCHKNDCQLIFEVEDDGIGMQQELADKLLSSPQKDSNKHMNQIGINNVNEIIKLHYGPQWGLKIKSNPRCGTIVKIYIPITRSGSM